MANQSYEKLVTALEESLQPHGYSERDDTSLGGIDFVARLMTPRRWLVRSVCTVNETPSDVLDVDTARSFFGHLRCGLAGAYARFPWFKELGTFAVLLCDSELYTELATHVEEFVDKTGFHVNVMIGIVLVDRDLFQSVADQAWGLFYSGKQFASISSAVSQWCEDQRRGGASA